MSASSSKQEILVKFISKPRMKLPIKDLRVLVPSGDFSASDVKDSVFELTNFHPGGIDVYYRGHFLSKKTDKVFLDNGWYCSPVHGVYSPNFLNMPLRFGFIALVTRMQEKLYRESHVSVEVVPDERVETGAGAFAIASSLMSASASALAEPAKAPSP
jgi:hypothetical protein